MPQQYMQAPMFYPPGQQPGFIPQAGRGMAYPQQGGRGGPGPQQMPPNMYGLPGQFPQGAPYGAQQGNPQFIAAMQQAQQAAALAGGRGGPGRGPVQGIPGMPGQPQMLGAFPQGGRQGGPAGRGAQGARPGQYPTGFPPQAGRGMPPQMPGMPLTGNELVGGALAQQLSAVPPVQQKQLLGEALFPKIQTLQPELAGKITGMLLEMENQELVNLIEDDAALRAKVDEALTVYGEYVKNNKGEETAESGDAKEEKTEEKA